MTDSVTALIIGSGFGGMCAALALRRAGIEDFRIVERRAFCGGTWCQNTYPGAAVDVQSPLYSLVGEPYDWTQMFAAQDELEAYTNHLLDKHGLREKTDTKTSVRAIRWDATSCRWEVRASGGRKYVAQFVIGASGPLSQPFVPNFERAETFAGESFHTNAWDHSVPLEGKRVAIVGSGASAAQVIPAIVDRVGELHVFQRTPNWVLPRPDRVFTDWQRRLLQRPWAYAALRRAVYWKVEARVVGFKYSNLALELIAARIARRMLREQVPDRALRAALTPSYTIGCKRVILSNTLYPALSRPQTTVYTADDAIARIHERGLVTTRGSDLELDVIVYATGYKATDGAIPYLVHGEDGRRLHEEWANLPSAYLGTMAAGFPNFFTVMGPNTGIGHTSAIFMIESQMEYIARAVVATREAGADALCPTQEAVSDYTDMIVREMDRTVWKHGGCQSWYQNNAGHVVAMFPGFSFSYRRLARRFVPAHHRFIGANGANPS